MWPRFLVSLVLAGVIAAPGLRVVLGEQLAGRKEQLASTSSSATTVDAAAAAAAKKKEQWIFATNWSLPPADILEFIVPGIFGNDSMRPPYPYWGALGRAYEWAPGQRVMPNYRQHTVYLGVLPVCFALFACLLWWRTRRRGDFVSTVQEAAGGGSALPMRDDPLADVPFWLGAGVVCLLLAMGRYTPFYRLFYALPYMDLVRCPVKFHHLVEVCTAFLCGVGVEMWRRGAVVAAPAKRAATVEVPPAAQVGRWLTILAAGMFVVLLIAAAMVAASRAEIAQHIAQLGLGASADALAAYTAENLARSACVFGVAAMLMWFGRPRATRSGPATWLLAVLAVVLAVDLVTVARRFVHPIDLQPFYASHAVSDAAVTRGGVGSRVANYVNMRGPWGDWFANSLSWNGLESALDNNPESKDAPVMRALSKRTETLWRTMRARFVVAPWKAAAPMVKSQALVPLVSFSIEDGAVREAQPSPDALMLAEFAGSLPQTYVVESWQGGLSEEAQVQWMNGLDWDPGRLTLCSALGSTGGMSRVIGQAKVVRRRGSDFRLTTKVSVDTPQAGLLILDERYAGDLQVRIDGSDVPVHRANALWAAVQVPAGRYDVTVCRRWHVLPVLLSGGGGLAIGVWGLARLFHRRRSLGGQKA